MPEQHSPERQPAEHHPPERTAAVAGEPSDSDIDLHQGRPRRRRRAEIAVLAAIAAGGAAGAAARYLIGAAWPTPVGAFPVSTLAINVLGCALIGVLMVLMTDVWSRLRLLRPFLGTGVLGGFTTFSTYTVDIQRLAAGAHPGPALLYLALTPIDELVTEGLVILDDCDVIRYVGTNPDGVGGGHAPMDTPGHDR